MKRYKNRNILILTLLTLIHFTSIPVFADVTEYQNPNTNMEESSADCEVIYKTTYDFSEEIPKYPELDVTTFGYEEIYDGKSHGIIVDCKTEGATILYSTDGKTYSTKKPEYKDVGTYVTYYKVEKDGYTAVTGSETVKITEAAIDYTSADYSGLYDGKPHGIELSIYTDGCKILYSEDGINYSSKKPAYKEVGTYITYYKISKDNYTTVTGSNKVIIGSNTIDYTSHDYIGVYDGKPHGITVSVSTDGCEILYSTDGINYSSEKPTYKEVGTYVTYFKILKDGYETVTGSNRVVINEQYNNNNNDSSDTEEHVPSENISKVQTGDETCFEYLIGLCIFSGMGLILLTIRNKKKS